MTTFNEFLFNIIPARVEAGDLDANNPVAKLAARHKMDIIWPSSDAEKWEILDHLTRKLWIRTLSIPPLAYRSVKWERQIMLEAFTPIIENLVDDLLATRHALNMAWKDYEKYCEEKTDE